MAMIVRLVKLFPLKQRLALYGRNHVTNIRIFNYHYNCLTKSPLLNQPVVVMINNVGLPFGLSNIIDHNNNISNVGLHLVQQMYINSLQVSRKGIMGMHSWRNCGSIIIFNEE